MRSRHLALLAVLSTGCAAIAGVQDMYPPPDDTAAAGASGGGGTAGIAGIGSSSGGAGGAGAGASGGAGAGGIAGGAGGGAGDGGAGDGGAGNGGAGNGGAAGVSTGGAGAGAGAAGTAGTSGSGGGEGGSSGKGGAGQAGAGSGGKGGGGPDCALSALGDGALRFANMAPDAKRVQFCVKPASQPDFGGMPPLSKGMGAPCPTGGLAYREVLAPAHLDPGVYTVKSIPDTADCGAPGTAILEDVLVEAGPPKTIVRIGGTGVPEALLALPESLPTPTTTLVRLVHAAAGFPSLQVGLPSQPTWPMSLVVPVFTPTPFGKPAGPGSTPVGMIDGNGYASLAVAGADQTLAAAQSGSTEVMAFGHRKLVLANTYTAFVVGDALSPSFPLELLICRDTQPDGLKATCFDAAPLDVAFHTFNPTLDGLYAPDENARRGPLLDAIKQVDADVLCLNELPRGSDKDAFIAALASTLPYTHSTFQTLASPIDDPTDKDGNTPTPYATPPCGDASLSKMEVALGCLRDKCSTLPGNDAGVVSDGACVPNSCTSQVVPLLIGSKEDKRCWSCTFYEMASGKSVGAMRESCTTKPDAGLMFDGQNQQVLLSRYPLDASRTEHWTLPAAGWRTTVLRSGVKVPNGMTVDVYCAVLTTPDRSEFTQPYVGFWGAGAATNAWENENHLQAQKLAAFIRKRSGPGPSVLLGDLYVGPAYAGTEGPPVKGTAEPSFQVLTSSFGIGVAPGYVPSCTLCGENPWVDIEASASTWTSHILLGGIPAVAVTATTRTFLDTVVPHPKAGLAPVSPRYGIRSVIRLAR